MSERCDDICPRPDRPPAMPNQPLVVPPYLTSVWCCESTEQAEQILSGELEGFVYQRDAHPNAAMLADKCRQLHRADAAVMTSSGMSALAALLLSQTTQGDHLVVSNRLYGRSQVLLLQEAARLGITATLVDTCDLRETAAALTPRTRLLITETIANPTLEVADLAALAELARTVEAALLVDNTFATPALCRPLEWGAELVMESVSKMMNGHSDVMLGLACGRESRWERVAQVVATWGLASSPFDCFLSSRGLATMHLRMERACDNALQAARWLARHPGVAGVLYPGLESHPQHALAGRQLGGRYGSMVTFHLPGGRLQADAFIRAARQIPFCPSLGEVSTTLSHPQSTSHRSLTERQREALGILGGTIRLSVGCESAEHVLGALAEAFDHLPDAAWTRRA
ncbi:MAG: aminotransferase class I/II-fold pyridoxal phosphate-dependent enzyme [Pirellulaceae bacterium]|nr:aminotransferase class I/II-fold pyridoxal phosphate-dependent enzyme [Pirellulaceae bacterium]